MYFERRHILMASSASQPLRGKYFSSKSRRGITDGGSFVSISSISRTKRVRRSAHSARTLSTVALSVELFPDVCEYAAIVGIETARATVAMISRNCRNGLSPGLLSASSILRIAYNLAISAMQVSRPSPIPCLGDAFGERHLLQIAKHLIRVYPLNIPLQLRHASRLLL